MVYSINIRTSQRTELLDITDKIGRIVKDSRASEGMCYIYTPHTTAALTINENADPSVRKDIISTLNAVIPKRGNYAHSEGNSDAHIKASLVGTEKAVIIEGARLRLGTWQGIFFCEFDGPRSREVCVKIIKDTAK